jgi:hypothetical protein
MFVDHAAFLCEMITQVMEEDAIGIIDDEL